MPNTDAREQPGTRPGKHKRSRSMPGVTTIDRYRLASRTLGSSPARLLFLPRTVAANHLADHDRADGRHGSRFRPNRGVSLEHDRTNTGQLSVVAAGCRDRTAYGRRSCRCAGHSNRFPASLVGQLHPDSLITDPDGRRRRQGSRRHGDLASTSYTAAAHDITTAMAGRYGNHDAVIGWQIDNEFGDHDTGRSWSSAAKTGFQGWLASRYASISAS